MYNATEFSRKERTPFRIEPLTAQDLEWARPVVEQHCGSEPIVTPSGVYSLNGLPGVKAVEEGQPVGLLHYSIQATSCEIVTLASLVSNRGIGSALIAAVHQIAQDAGCHRLWVSTTNDNLNALRFYQKRSFYLVTVHQNGMQRVRQIKPQVPLLGMDGIPLRDVLELEQVLAPQGAE